MRIHPLFVSVLLSACGLSEDKFIEKAARKTCDKAFQCADEEDEYEIEFDDEEECREFIEGLAQPQGDEADCEYDEEAARDCLNAYDELDCDDIKEGTSPPECADVYTGECAG